MGSYSHKNMKLKLALALTSLLAAAADLPLVVQQGQSAEEIEFREALKVLASEIEPRSYAVSLKAAETMTIENGDSNEESSYLEIGAFAFIILIASVYLIMHFFA